MEDMAVIHEYKTLCAQSVQSSLQALVRETRGGLRVRPQLPSGSVFACSFTGQPLGPQRLWSTRPRSVCRC